MDIEEFMAKAYKEAEEYACGVSTQAEYLVRAAWETQQLHIEALEKELAYKQSQIDSLMLEYCPEECKKSNSRNSPSIKL